MGQIDLGVSNVARNVSQPSIGVSGVVRSISNGYVGISGVARQFFTGLDETLGVDETEDIYWKYFGLYGMWKYDSETSYRFIMSMSGALVSDNGSEMVHLGGTMGAPKDTFKKYASGSSHPSKYAAAFFCLSASHANAMVKCIQNNYTQMNYSWVDFWSDAMNPKTTDYKRTITSVTSLGKCSDIGYKIYYANTDTGYYDFSTDSNFKDLYVVEILTDSYLYCSRTKGSNCCPVVVFS